MALFNDALKGRVPNALIGVGVALAAPIVLPALAVGARPLAKTLLKGYLAAAEAVQGVVVGATEQLGDLVAEVQAERSGASAPPWTSTAGGSIDT
jgi:Protein of unknown function (DUF5132)